MKEMMTSINILKMAIGAHIELEDLGILRTLWHLTDLSHWWLLNSISMSNTIFFSTKPNEDNESHLICCNDWMNSQGKE